MLFVLGFSAAVWIVGWLLHRIYKQRDRSVWDPSVTDVIAQIVWIKCDIYIMWLGLSRPVRRAMTNVALLAAAFSVLPVLLDVLAMVAGHRLVEFDIPAWLQIVIVVTLTALARHRYHEWKRAGERSKFTTAMRFVFREVGALTFRDSDSEQKRLDLLDAFITNVLGAFHAIYRERLDAKLNVMALTGDQVLRIQYVYPVGTRYDENAIFAPGEGTAGCAFKQGKLLYVPAIRYRHGLAVTFPRPSPQIPKEVVVTYERARDVYKPVTFEPYSCVMSVPIKAADGETYGVLNLDCSAQNAFNEADMEIADAAACALGLGVDRYRSLR